jgi:hypothetical protein
VFHGKLSKNIIAYLPVIEHSIFARFSFRYERDYSEGSINQRLAEGVAFLLGNNFEKRLLYTTRTKDLYRKRSAIVHNGKPVSLSELLEFNRIVFDVIHSFIRHKFASFDKFTEWENRQKYTVAKR